MSGIAPSRRGLDDVERPFEHGQKGFELLPGDGGDHPGKEGAGIRDAILPPTERPTTSRRVWHCPRAFRLPVRIHRRPREGFRAGASARFTALPLRRRRHARSGRCLPGGHPTWTLRNERGDRRAVLCDEGFDVRSLPPLLAPGPYTLLVSVGDMAGAACLALPLEGDDGRHAYPLGQVRVE